MSIEALVTRGRFDLIASGAIDLDLRPNFPPYNQIVRGDTILFKDSIIPPRYLARVIKAVRIHPTLSSLFDKEELVRFDPELKGATYLSLLTYAQTLFGHGVKKPLIVFEFDRP